MRLTSWLGKKSANPRGRRSWREIARDRSGVAAVEFAMLGLPFLLLLLLLLETGGIFIAELVMDQAVSTVGREVRTGQVTNADLTEAEFKNKICQEVNFLFDCANLHVDLRTYGSFSSISNAVPVKDGDIDGSGFAYTKPGSEQIAALKVYYKWPLYTEIMRSSITDMSDRSFVIVGTAVFQTEPF